MTGVRSRCIYVEAARIEKVNEKNKFNLINSIIYNIHLK